MVHLSSITASATAALLATLPLTSALNLDLQKRDTPKVIKHAVQRRVLIPADFHARNSRNDARANRLRKRAGTVTETLDNFESGSLYFANATLGTPAQNLRFHIDTGSSDLWTNAQGSAFCSQSTQQLEQEGNLPCSVSGEYSANSSSTYQYVNSIFNISYADGSGASGDYAKDTFVIGETSVKALQFGIGYQSTSAEGVLGIGYSTLEAQNIYYGQGTYPNLPVALANAGDINVAAYSLWLDDLESATGSILFGGVDTSKFEGTLTSLPVLKVDGQYLEMIVTLSGVSMTSSSSTNTTLSSTPMAALLDSGTTLTYLPSSIAQNIYTAVGARYDSQSGEAIVPCSLAQNTQLRVTYEFDGASISVPMSELVLDAGSATECLFGIVEQDQEPYTLGDTFLRSAYVVYDTQNNEISLAQTNFNPSGESNVLEITSGSSGVPSATGVPANAAEATGSETTVAGLAHASPTSNPGSMPTAGAGSVLALVGGIVAAVAL